MLVLVLVLGLRAHLELWLELSPRLVLSFWRTRASHRLQLITTLYHGMLHQRSLYPPTAFYSQNSMELSIPHKNWKTTKTNERKNQKKTGLYDNTNFRMDFHIRYVCLQEMQ